MKKKYSLKRGIEVILVIVIYILILPIMLYSAYRIKSISKDGPILRRVRCNRNGKIFILLEFRSMHLGHFCPYTEKVDRRVFSYGKFMRKTKINLLPRFWNVLMGDMELRDVFVEIDIECFFKGLY